MYQKTLFFGVNVIYNKKREFFSTQNYGTYNLYLVATQRNSEIYNKI